MNKTTHTWQDFPLATPQVLDQLEIGTDRLGNTLYLDTMTRRVMRAQDLGFGISWQRLVITKTIYSNALFTVDELGSITINDNMRRSLLSTDEFAALVGGPLEIYGGTYYTKKISFIKELRAARSWGLKESKDFCDWIVGTETR